MKKSKIHGTDYRTAQGKAKPTFSQLLYTKGSISGNMDDLGNSFYRQSRGAVVSLGVGNHIFDGVNIFDTDSDVHSREYPLDVYEHFECDLFQERSSKA